MSNYTAKLLNLKRGQFMLYTALLFFVVVIFWVILTLFSSQNKTEVSSELRRLALPLNPNIDTQVLTTIQNKRVYNESSLSNFPIYMVIRSDDGKTQQVVPIEVGRAATNTSAAVPVPIVASSSADVANPLAPTESSQPQTNEAVPATTPTPASTESATPVVQ